MTESTLSRARLGDDDAFLPPEFSCIRMLGVEGTARGRGVGRALVQRCIDRSREAGASGYITKDRIASELVAAIVEVSGRRVP